MFYMVATCLKRGQVTRLGQYRTINVLKLEWSEWCVWIKHAQTINFDSKLKNSATIWLRLVFVIIQNVQMSLGLLLLLSLRKEENRFFSTGKQQKSIDCLIGDALIINTCKGQHLVVSAVWQQHKQYHLQLHCVKC